MTIDHLKLFGGLYLFLVTYVSDYMFLPTHSKYANKGMSCQSNTYVENTAAPGGAKNERSAASVRRAVLFKNPMNCNSEMALEKRACVRAGSCETSCKNASMTSGRPM